MNKKLWGGRYTSETNTDVEAYTASIDFDIELLFDDILGSMAHARMLTQYGILTTTENDDIQRGLKNIAQQAQTNQLPFSIQDEDIHMNIERLLFEKIGATAGKLHTARSRNDQVALDLHLYLRRQIIILVQSLSVLQNTLITLAKQHREIILPGYTHLQRAQPIYLAQHWLAYVAMFQRDMERLVNLWTRANQSPLGAAALTGTSFAIDREAVAKMLAFDGIYYSTLDAVSDRDFVIEFLAASAMTMMHLSRISEECILWSSQEFNFISFDDSYSTGSSIMPQKKNPDVAELARGKTGRVYGALIALLTLLKGLPLAYNKDLQEDKEPLFDVVKTLRQTISIYAPMLATLKIHPEKMRDAAQKGFLNATIFAEYLVKKGLAFRQAHEIVGTMVGYCINQKCTLEELSLAKMQSFCASISDDIYQTLSIDHAVKASTAAKEIDTAISQYEQVLILHHDWINKKQTALNNVYHQFDLPML